MNFNELDDQLKRAIQILIGVLVLIGFVYLFIFLLKVALYLLLIFAIAGAVMYIIRGNKQNNDDDDSKGPTIRIE